MYAMRSLGTIFIIFAFAHVAPGQERFSLQSADTSSTTLNIFTGEEILRGHLTLFAPALPGGRLTSGLPPLVFVSGYPRRISPFLGGPYQGKVDLVSPFRLQMERESRLGPFESMLISAEFAGAAYIAYRHIKKYGFP
jgi:hypothetical protein